MLIGSLLDDGSELFYLNLVVLDLIVFLCDVLLVFADFLLLVLDFLVFFLVLVVLLDEIGLFCIDLLFQLSDLMGYSAVSVGILGLLLYDLGQLLGN